MLWTMTQLENLERYLRTETARIRGPTERPRSRVRPFLTISRQAGAGGHALAATLVELFASQEDTELFGGWQVFDRELCEIVAQDAAFSGSLQSLLAEEYRTKADEFFSQAFRPGMDQTALMERAFRVVRAVASVGKAIVLGRAGSEVTRDMRPGISIRLVAPEPTRVARMMEVYGLEEREAIREAGRLDSSRARLLRDHFRVDIEDPARYDVVFNTGRLSMDGIAEAVALMLRVKVEASLAATLA